MNLAERACALTRRQDPSLLMLVAEIHAQAGRREMAVSTTEEAIAVARAAGNVDLADKLRRRLQVLQNGGDADSVRP
jgi:hypothetical protein